MRISDWSSDVCSSDLPAADGDRLDRGDAVDAVHEVEEVDEPQPGERGGQSIGRRRQQALEHQVRRIERPETQADGSHLHAEAQAGRRSEEHTSELQSLMRISYAVFCLKKKNKTKTER